MLEWGCPMDGCGKLSVLAVCGWALVFGVFLSLSGSLSGAGHVEWSQRQGLTVALSVEADAAMGAKASDHCCRGYFFANRPQSKPV